MSNITEKLARKSSPERGTTQVRLKLRHVSVGSVAKIAFLMGLAVGVVGVIAIMVAYGILNATGTFGQLDTTLGGVLGTSSGAVTSIVTPGRVFAISIVLALLDIVGFTLGGVIAAALYNASTRLTEGLFIGFTNR
jgi:hypothetical protein